MEVYFKGCCYPFLWIWQDLTVLRLNPAIIYVNVNTEFNLSQWKKATLALHLNTEFISLEELYPAAEGEIDETKWTRC